MTGYERQKLGEFPLVEIVRFGTREQNFAPGVKRDGSLGMDQDETVLWEAKTFVRGFVSLDGRTFREVWKPGSLEVLITDRRLLYYKLDYDHGIGGGFSLTSIALSSYSKHKAAKRREGTMAAGHVRYENLRQLCSGSRRDGLVNPDRPTLSFDMSGSGPGIVRAEVWLNRTEPGFEDLVRQWASYVAGREIPLIGG